ncbi:hypothetical protein GE061_002125 [Apolygus lucorum]|uniref:DUF4773 domain-containing protein n=1 Tax=Apolygus lucorum TaxID=248454 RepID=A0A8S9X3S4_APOLU|nr:hypothetical protein GE061_002125 [Apolygus lucorum]
MVSIKLFWILLVGVIASTLAASIDVEKNSLSESDEQVNERGLWITSEGEKRCSCDNVSCQCCVSPSILHAGKIKTCLKVTAQASEKSVSLELTRDNKVLVNKKFVVGAKDSMCATIPGSASTAQGCIDTVTSDLPNNAGFQTCPKLQLKAVGKAVATLNFACIQYSNKKLSFNDNGPVKASQKVGFKWF